MPSTGPLRVVSLYAENVKRLTAVEIVPDPDGSLVLLTGANGQGKSSVLDALWLAIGGKAAAKANPRPVRDGAKGARVVVDLGDLRVTRTWTSNDRSALKVESRDGARYPSPQALLDSLVGRLSFDPLAFSALPAAQQRKTLLELAELPLDLDDAKARRAEWYQQRTAVGRDVRNLSARVASMPIPEGVPDEEVDVSALVQQARDRRQAREREDVRRRRQAEAEAAAQRARQRLREAEQDLRSAEQQLALLPPEPSEELPDPEEIEDRITEAAEVNQLVTRKRERRSVEADLRDAEAEQEELTHWINALDDEVTAALAAAKLPLPGLAVDDEDGVTYDGVPLEQASSAERLRVSVAVAMALNPTVRVLRVSDGSLLDSRSMALIEELAADRGYQLWVERVDETGTVGVVIEDGQVRS